MRQFFRMKFANPGDRAHLNLLLPPRPPTAGSRAGLPPAPHSAGGRGTARNPRVSDPGSFGIPPVPLSVAAPSPGPWTHILPKKPPFSPFLFLRPHHEPLREGSGVQDDAQGRHREAPRDPGDAGEAGKVPPDQDRRRAQVCETKRGQEQEGRAHGPQAEKGLRERDYEDRGLADDDRDAGHGHRERQREPGDDERDAGRSRGDETDPREPEHRQGGPGHGRHPRADGPRQRDLGCDIAAGRVRRRIRRGGAQRRAGGAGAGDVGREAAGRGQNGAGRRAAERAEHRSRNCAAAAASQGGCTRGRRGRGVGRTQGIYGHVRAARTHVYFCTACSNGSN